MQTVGIVGAGMMGSGIAEAVAVAGLRAIVYEPERPLERSRERIEASLEKAVARGKVQPDVAADARHAIVHTTHIEDLLGAELVIEAVTEDEAIKTSVFRELDELLGPDVILASNTSSIPITTLAAATRAPTPGAGAALLLPRAGDGARRDRAGPADERGRRASRRRSSPAASASTRSARRTARASSSTRC